MVDVTCFSHVCGVCVCADRAAVASDYSFSSFSHILSALDQEMNFMSLKQGRPSDI